MDNLIEHWRNTFEYVDGNLVWKINIGTRAKAGNVAGCLHKDGYYRVVLSRKSLLVHRVIFAIIYGYLPTVVDHVDRNRSNNNITNLREADFSTNIHNSSVSVVNTSGEKGVRLTKNNKYEARVAKRGVTYQVGTFESLDAATIALRAFREKLHGQFHCHG